MPVAAREDHVVGAVAARGLPVEAVTPVRPSLEDVFVALVRREGGAVAG